MLQRDEPDDFVIATGSTRKLREFVAEAFAQVGLNWEDHVRTDPALLRPTDIRQGNADPRKAARELSWRAVNKMGDVVRLMMEAE
jgi:GDPmannose 4,6-dehydratase